ncbi:MAG: hypothetical protein MUD01_02905 [Chloroflexaceae bacterium]|nr:hypothetical protein [Chloroflexaceae bacterium]
MRRRMYLLGIVALLLPLLGVSPLAAQTGERCFRETGFCISGPIRTYWEQNGGLAQFGVPISGIVDDTAYEDWRSSWVGSVQWFERGRLELHEELGGRVLAGRVGAEQHFRLNQTLVIAKPQPHQPQAGCRFFGETQQNLCEPYLSYWQRNGGLARMGLPLSTPALLTSGAWSGEVQWFERVRMERHHELPGAPILLGRLGVEWRLDQPSATCPRPVFDQVQRSFQSAVFHLFMGCPGPTMRGVRTAEQYFERGVMVWVEVPTASGALDRRIFVIRGVPLPLKYDVFDDPWTEGQPESGNLTPPPGLLEPKRGFGQVWRSFPEVRDDLGWATEGEVGHMATVQPFQSAVAPHVGLVWFEDTDFFFAFGPGTQVTAFKRYPEPLP